MKFSDSHAHYSSKRFKKDRDELLNKLFTEDLEYIIECGTSTFWNEKVIELCEKYENMYGVIGYCPIDVQELNNEKTWEMFKKQLSHKKILGIGEFGLDYHHSPDTKNEQILWFKRQLDLAYELNLPVCIHSRQAELDTLKVLTEAKNRHGVIHCYAYGIETMKKLVDLGYYFGVGGTCTYEQYTDLREAVKEMPLERIVLETDAPYLTPHPLKGRNDSSMIKNVIKEISILKGVPEETVIEQTNKNLKILYPKLDAKKS